MAKNFITFKYLRNVTLSFGDGPLHSIPVRTVPFMTALPERDPNRPKKLAEEYPEVQELLAKRGNNRLGVGEYRIAITSDFDMDKVFTIELADEKPQIPVREDDMSDRYYDSLRDEAYTLARENKKKNDLIRSRVNGYARPSTSTLLNGVEVEIPPAIQILHDSFQREMVADSPELDARVRESSKGASKNDSKTKAAASVED